MPRQSANPTSDGYRSNQGTEPDRRAFLRATAGMAAATVGVAVASPTAADTDYETTLDIVEDLGADNTGEEPINDALAEAVEYDSVKVEFPDGEYVIHEGAGDGFARWDFGKTEEEEDRVGKLALVGTGDATLRPPDGGRHNILTIWGDDITVQNFTVDQDGDTSTGITTVAEDRLLLRDISFVGEITGDYEEVSGPNHDEDIPDDPKCLIPGLLSEDGEGLIENIRCAEGGPSLSRKGGVWVNFLHAGDMLFRRCEFSNFADNAIYGSPPGGSPLGEGGSVRVENCYFKNNNVTAIRLGTPGSYAKNCTIVTEEGEVPATPWGAITSRAGWVWYDFDGSYENIDVIHNHSNGQGIFDHSDNSQDVALEVRNSRLELNNDGGRAIRFSDPGVESLSVNNVSVTGEAAGETALELGNCDIDIDNLCVHNTGEDRDGISLSSVTGSISNSVIDVTGEQFVVSGDTDVEVTNLHDEGNCPSPKSDHDYDAPEKGETPTPPDDTGRDEQLLGESGDEGDDEEDVDYDFRISDVDLLEGVVYGDDMGIGSVTITNHGDETETVEVGVWNDFLEAFLDGTVTEVTLEPDESTTVDFALSQDISSPNSTYDLAISTGSDRVEFTIDILEADDEDEDEDTGDEDEDDGDDDEDGTGEDEGDDDDGEDEDADDDDDEDESEDEDMGDDEDDEDEAADDSDGSPGFTGLVTLGALATSGAAMARRLSSTADQDQE